MMISCLFMSNAGVGWMWVQLGCFHDQTLRCHGAYLNPPNHFGLPSYHVETGAPALLRVCPLEFPSHVCSVHWTQGRKCLDGQWWGGTSGFSLGDTRRCVSYHWNRNRKNPRSFEWWFWWFPLVSQPHTIPVGFSYQWFPHAMLILLPQRPVLTRYFCCHSRSRFRTGFFHTLTRNYDEYAYPQGGS